MKHVLKAEVTAENLRDVLKNVGITLTNNMEENPIKKENLPEFFTKIIYESLEFGIIMAFSIQSMISDNLPLEKKAYSLNSFTEALKKQINTQIELQRKKSELFGKGGGK